MDYGHPIIAQVVFDQTRISKGIGMLRFQLKGLVADKEFREGRRVTLDEIQQATGIHRTTLSKIANQKVYNTTTDNLDKLCAFFDCRVEHLMGRVKDGRNSVRF